MHVKAAWEVHAGVVPGVPNPDVSKRFEYTSKDDEADRRDNPDGQNPFFHSRLAKVRAEALDYYLLVSLPQLNNWASLQFMWY